MIRERACPYCGITFSRDTSPANIRTFCSYTCAARSRGDQIRGTGKKASYVYNGHERQHRVVMEQKLGRKLRPGEVVHHIDRNTRNNDPDNLELKASQADHIREHMLGNHHTALLNEEQVKQIRALYATGQYYYRELGEMFSVSYNTIGDIIRGTSWKI